MSLPERLRMRPTPKRMPSRVLIEGVTPQIDGGRFPAKRTVGEMVRVGADIFCDGHEVLAGVVRYRHEKEDEWCEAPLAAGPNDRWEGEFPVDVLGTYEFTVRAWIDRFASWRHGFTRKVEAGQDVGSELLEGAELIRHAAGPAPRSDGDWLRRQADLVGGRGDAESRTAAALDPGLKTLMLLHADRSLGAEYDRVLPVTVDRVRARFGSWYELFPRSTAEPGRHGTFKDVIRRLPYVANMGFDVLYLPPIHPIGRAYRKGPNNTLNAGSHDPGSPWAIGAAEGGHDAILSDLGTLDDFDLLVTAARDHGIELALDIAFQCSPDHPWVKEHPAWFRHRPDGTIKYAENPPKKYQDIYPLDFEGDDWRGLWEALRDVFLFWVGRGVLVFRVDNPHTKAFAFWEWVIGEVQRDHPEAIFLAEAFTRPKVMKYLAKCGFTQSYSYFTWRNTKWELTEYLTELTTTDVREVMRPNFFANTPDILPEYLQYGGRAAFYARLVLAGTLTATYGIYGPPYENAVNLPVRHGSEEFLDSEKYEVRHWNWDDENPLRDFIARVNRIRRENPALQSDHRLKFHHVDNDRLIAYSKTTADQNNLVFVVVNLDPHHEQAGWARVPLHDFGMDPHEPYQVHDLLTDARYLWHGEANFVQLPAGLSHIFRLRRKVKTERDFDYFH